MCLKDFRDYKRCEAFTDDFHFIVIRLRDDPEERRTTGLSLSATSRPVSSHSKQGPDDIRPPALGSTSFARGDLWSFLSRRRIANGLAWPVPSICFYSDVDNARRGRSADLCKDGSLVSAKGPSSLFLGEGSTARNPMCIRMYVYIYIYTLLSRLVVRHDTWHRPR